LKSHPLNPIEIPSKSPENPTKSPEGNRRLGALDAGSGGLRHQLRQAAQAADGLY